jgi:hypothetical protein
MHFHQGREIDPWHYLIRHWIMILSFYSGYPVCSVTKSKSFLPSPSLNKPLGMLCCVVQVGSLGCAPEWFRRLRGPRLTGRQATTPQTPCIEMGTSTSPETTASRDNGNHDDDHGLSCIVGPSRRSARHVEIMVRTGRIYFTRSIHCPLRLNLGLTTNPYSSLPVS